MGPERPMGPECRSFGRRYVVRPLGPESQGDGAFGVLGFDHSGVVTWFGCRGRNVGPTTSSGQTVMT